MSVHDYNIANQGFPAFRTDLNDALAAIVSNNSNATAPATTFAHMIWVDTAANPSVLKIRNADNDAWITIGSLNQTDDKFKLTPADGVSTDTISELTSAAGVTIDGVLLKDNGVVTGAGTVSAPVYSTTGDTNTGIFFPAADTIAFAEGGAEAMRITDAGNVGIGTTSPGVPLTVRSNSGGNAVRLLGRAADGFAFLAFRNNADSANNAEIGISDAQNMLFTVGGSERMRIDSSGNLLIATTSTNETTSVGVRLINNGGIRSTRSESTGAASTLDVYSTGASAYRFYVDMAGTVFATNTTISAISDQRYKENIRDLDVGLDAVMQLRPRKFDWKEGKGQDTKDCRGFIAQEFEQVFPDLIDEWKDPAPEGEEPYKSVRQDLIPVLVKAIQELSAKNDALEARLSALEQA